MNLIWKIKSFFKKRSKTPYELVEAKVDDGFRQGVLINQPEKFAGIVATFSPKVSLTEEDGCAILRFDYRIEKNPNNIELTDQEIRPILGDIALDLIKKDIF